MDLKVGSDHRTSTQTSMDQSTRHNRHKTKDLTLQVDSDHRTSTQTSMDQSNRHFRHKTKDMTLQSWAQRWRLAAVLRDSVFSVIFVKVVLDKLVEVVKGDDR